MRIPVGPDALLPDRGRPHLLPGQPPQAINPGDIVNIPPNTMHWHGAAPDRLFAHLALSEAGEKGEGTAWGEHVSDSEYTKPVSG